MKLFSLYLSFFFLLHPSIKGEWKAFSSGSDPKEPEINVLEASGSELIVEVSLSGIESKNFMIRGKSFQKIHLPGYFTTFEEGKPKVPYISKLVCIPDQAIVNISLIDSSVVILKNYLVEPCYKQVGQKLEYCIDTSFYNSKIFYPSSYVSLTNKGTWRDLNVHSIKIFPIKYNPITRELKIYKKWFLD